MYLDRLARIGSTRVSVPAVKITIGYVASIFLRTRSFVDSIASCLSRFKQLRGELKRLGIRNTSRDLYRDLFVQDDRNDLLFEIKTDSDTSSVYSAIGQLMLHGRAVGVERCILAAPELRNRHAERLKILGIEFLEYRLERETVRFVGLNKLLGAKKVPRK